MLEVGQRVPDVSVWSSPQERKTIAEVADGARTLFLFYLFDWSAT
jgi:hypothetical protein